ncbi:unnamed protein product [Urochloa decumbens]|uniref:Secreted protein n=1 Tax=Urochloa decumbens TaxID=240449 RepID=A0ABC9H742_9POAL
MSLKTGRNGAMTTFRALSLALLLVFCFAACDCATSRVPKNRYISYATVPHARGQNGGGHAPGCSLFMVSQPLGPNSNERRRHDDGRGIKGEYMSQAALPSDDKHQVPKKVGAKTRAAGSKGRRYISPAAMAADKPCDRPGCPPRP